MADPERGRTVLGQLRRLGVRTSIDDYGTGYSSLAYLRHLPADELKLDRSLTADVGTDPRAAAIVEHTVALAHDLGLRLVAEGVEDDGDRGRAAGARLRRRAGLRDRPPDAGRGLPRLAGHRARPSPAWTPHPRLTPQRQLGRHLARHEVEVVEVGEVEHLQVHPLGPASAYRPRTSTASAGVPATPCARSSVDVAADRRGPAGELGVVLADAEHQRRAVDQGRRVATGLLAGLPDAGEQPRVVLRRARTAR